jgi:hypothetical protein
MDGPFSKKPGFFDPARFVSGGKKTTGVVGREMNYRAELISNCKYS